MKRLFYAATAAALCFNASYADRLKMSATSMQVALHYQDVKKNPGKQFAPLALSPIDINSAATSFDGSANLSGFMATLSQGVTAEDIKAAGFTVTNVIGEDFVMGTGTMDDIISLAKSALVESVELPQLMQPMLDASRTSIGMNYVHEGAAPLTQPYDGTDVICGIYDQGVDPNHLNFLTRDLKENRVKALWVYSSSSGVARSYSTPEAIAAVECDSKTDTHGTHTLGCMAGAHNTAGNGTGLSGSIPQGTAALLNATGSGVTKLTRNKNPYYGMAPNATLAVACGQLYNNNILAGVDAIVNYANSLGKTPVINLSLGSVSGPHDGTDDFTRKLDELGKKAIILVAAGNDGENNFSISKTLSSSETSFQTLISASGNYVTLLEFYSSDNRQFKVTPMIYDTTTRQVKFSYTFTGTGNGYFTTKGYNGTGYIHNDAIDQAFSSLSTVLTGSANTGTNNRYSVSVSLSANYNSSTNPDKNLVMGFKVEGQPGQRIDIISRVTSGSAEMSSMGIAGFTNGTPDLSVSNLACGKNTICIGAYNVRNRFPAKGGIYSYTDTTTLKAGHVAGFSSYGVLADGRSLPDVCAPGTAIISSYNSYYTNNTEWENGHSASFKWNGRYYIWAAEQGTSMATPIAAGVVATWLQAKPTLTVEDVRTILKETATKDNFVNTGDPVRWGAGKINAYEGLKRVLGLDGVADISLDKEQDVLISSPADNVFEAFVNCARKVNMVLYTMSGTVAKNVTASGNTATLDGNNLPAGIYLLSVNGGKANRVVIR